LGWANAHVLPEWEGRVYPGVHGVLQLQLLLTVHVCSACKEGGQIEGLVPIIKRLTLR